MNAYERTLATTIACALFGGFVVMTAGALQGPAGGKMSADEILAYHTKDEKSGSAEAGRPLYEKQCAACHRFGAIGKDVGPDLTTIASRFKKKDVLESILWPSKVISDQYQAEMLELADGKFVTGVLVRESAAAVLIRTGDNPDKPIAIPKAQIVNRAPSTVSLMPEGLLDGLSQEQVANLLAFVLAPAPQ